MNFFPGHDFLQTISSIKKLHHFFEAAFFKSITQTIHGCGGARLGRVRVQRWQALTARPHPNPKGHFPLTNS